MELVFVGGRKFKWGFHSEEECLLALVKQVVVLKVKIAPLINVKVQVQKTLTVFPTQLINKNVHVHQDILTALLDAKHLTQLHH